MQVYVFIYCIKTVIYSKINYIEEIHFKRNEIRFELMSKSLLKLKFVTEFSFNLIDMSTEGTGKSFLINKNFNEKVFA